MTAKARDLTSGRLRLLKISHCRRPFLQWWGDPVLTYRHKFGARRDRSLHDEATLALVKFDDRGMSWVGGWTLTPTPRRWPTSSASSSSGFSFDIDNQSVRNPLRKLPARNYRRFVAAGIEKARTQRAECCSAVNLAQGICFRAIGRAELWRLVMSPHKHRAHVRQKACRRWRGSRRDRGPNCQSI
jgi:hypothetical protein